MTTAKSRQWWNAAFVVGAFLLYYFCLPFTVQTNDTGEVVANSYLLHLIHPPGYPLYMWLYHGFMKAVPVSTPFFRAALMTSILACAALFVILRLPPTRTLIGILCLASFATLKIFWEYAVLPDVFMLHALLSAVAVWIFLSDWPGRKRLLWLGALMGLGIANHHTAIFWAPFYFYAAYEHRNFKDILASAALSLAICGLFYATLMWVTQPHLLDWRYLTSWAQLSDHFFRKDYGTFRLALIGTSSGPFAVIWLFLKSMMMGMPVLTVAAFGFPKSNRRLHIVAFVLASYILIFLMLCNLPTYGDYIQILERFLVFPALMTAIVGLYGIDNLWPSLRPSIQRLVIAGVLVTIGSNLAQRSEVDYSKDTLIEDYAIDILNRAGAKPNSILLLRTDTMLVGTRYVQYVLGYQEQVPAFNIGALSRPHINPFIQNLVPEIQFVKRWSSMNELEPAFVKLNAEKVRIVSMQPLETPGLALRKLRAGYEVVPLAQAGAVEDPIAVTDRTKNKYLPDLVNRFSMRLFLSRCDYYIDHAEKAHAQKRFEDALGFLKSGLEHIPNCFKAKEFQCRLFSEQTKLGSEAACLQEYELIKAIYAP